MINHKPETLARHEACAAVIREHWGSRPVREVAEIARETYSFVQKIAADIGMPRLSTRTMDATINMPRPSGPRGYSQEDKKWAQANFSTNKEAAMIRAHLGKDVRHLGFR
jgi:hypothetical protein